jgi:chemotaxis protein MotA
MVNLIGMVLILVAVVTGYTMHHGDLGVLNQPHEFIIIGGVAFGSMLVSTPIKIIKAMIGQMIGVLKGPPKKKDYLDLLTLLYELFQIAQKQGLLGWEEHINDPHKSSVFGKYPSFLKNHHAEVFLTDTMKVIVSGAADPHDLEDLMESDLETMHTEEHKAPTALNSVGDALPGVGIVAAVLGIIITMGAIDGPPAVVGMNVASALVGTFIGILASYGFLGPLSAAMNQLNDEGGKYIGCIKYAILGHAKGLSPSIAVEFARRTIYSTERPTFDELEQACRGAKG